MNKRAKKILFSILIVSFLAIIALLAALPLYVNPLVKGVVTTAGPVFMGVPVSVSNVDIRVYSGRIEMDGLCVGNPEGYSEDKMFTIDRIVFQVSLLSLLKVSSPVVVREITLESPVILYEVAHGKSNVDAVLERLNSEAEKKPAKEGGRKVVIDLFRLSGGQLNYRHKMLTAGAAVPLPLPPIKLTGIGAKSGGATALQAVASIMTGIVTGIGGVVADAAVSIGKGVGKAAVGTAKAVGHGTAVVAGAVGDAASAVGNAVGGAASGLVSLFTGGDDKDEPKEAETGKNPPAENGAEKKAP